MMSTTIDRDTINTSVEHYYSDHSIIAAADATDEGHAVAPLDNPLSSRAAV
jgi:hypothetical protein